MAALNEILNGRFSQLLTRLFNVTGGAPAPQLTPEIMPVAVVQDDTPELQFLKGSSLLIAGQKTGNAVGKQAYVQLSNPLSSGLIIRCNGSISNPQPATAQDMGYGITTISTRTPTRVQPRDSRVNDQLAAVQFGPGNFVGGSDLGGDGIGGPALTDVPRLVMAALAVFVIPETFVLHPGNAFTIWSNDTNLPVQAIISWSARRAEPGELQL